MVNIVTTPVQAAKAAAKLRLHHYSPQPNLTRTDPTLQGTGLKGEEAARVQRGAPQGTFYYTSDRRPEAGVGGNEYVTDVDPARLYDLRDDPDGILRASLDRFKNPPTGINPGVTDTAGALNATENILKERGFLGFIGKNESAKIFEPLDVRPAGSQGFDTDTRLFHGTDQDFKAAFRGPTFITTEPELANRFAAREGGNVIPVHSKVQNVFDTRNPEHRNIFEREFFGRLGTGTPLSERGLPDWTDGDDIREFLQERGGDFDAVAVDEPPARLPSGEFSPRESLLVFDPKNIRSVFDDAPSGRADPLDLTRKGETSPAQFNAGLPAAAAATGAAALTAEDAEAAPNPLTLGKIAKTGVVPAPRQQFALPRYEPPRGRPKSLDSKILGKRNGDRLKRLVDAGLERGGGEWYHTGPLYDEFVAELGPELGPQRFDRFMDMAAATSPRSKVAATIKRASLFYGREQQGLPIAGLTNPDLSKGFGHLAHQTQDFLLRDLQDAGGFESVSRPKVSSFGENLKGNFEPMTIDTHNRGVVMRDNKIRSPSATEYIYLEEFQTKLSDDLGIAPAQWQSSLWVGADEITGVADSRPFVEMFDEAVTRTAARKETTRGQVIQDFITGKAPLGAIMATVAAGSLLTPDQADAIPLTIPRVDQDQDPVGFASADFRARREAKNPLWDSLIDDAIGASESLGAMLRETAPAQDLGVILGALPEDVRGTLETGAVLGSGLVAETAGDATRLAGLVNPAVSVESANRNAARVSGALQVTPSQEAVGLETIADLVETAERVLGRTLTENNAIFQDGRVVFGALGERAQGILRTLTIGGGPE